MTPQLVLPSISWRMFVYTRKVKISAQWISSLRKGGMTA